MIAQLDEISRATIGRFALKICVSILIAPFLKAGYVVGTAWWLAIYAICTAAIALLLRQRFPTNSFNHWDEALWLMAVSMALRIVHKALT